MSFGPHPWQQRHWDWRAACNFMFGGAGAGLIIVTLLIAPPRPPAALFTGLGLVALGLTAVWLEIGRPLRALHVMFNPFTSWMTRESFAALALFPLAIAAAIDSAAALAVSAALAALVFAWCQARILQASKGIPAWREPSLGWLVMATALTEGAAIASLFAAFGAGAGAARGDGSAPALEGWLALALVARGLAWPLYRQRVTPGLSRDARSALEGAGRILMQLGTVVPLALLAASFAIDAVAPAAAALGALAALAAGWQFKFVLVTRAAFNQGFALPQLPVRGTR